MERWREGDGKDGSDGGQGGIYSRYVIMLTDVEPFANDKILEDYLQVKTWMSKCIRLVTRLTPTTTSPTLRTYNIPHKLLALHFRNSKESVWSRD